jgi:putative transposase
MTKPTIALVEYLRNMDFGADSLREAMRMLARLRMEAEVGGQIGAECYERSEERTAERNGYGGESERRG